MADRGGRETTPPRTGPHQLMTLLLALLAAWPAHIRTATMFARGCRPWLTPLPGQSGVGSLRHRNYGGYRARG